MPVIYIPDEEFHSSIDAALKAEGSWEADNHEERDKFLTETKLAEEGLWPASWHDLMADDQKEVVIGRILAERRARRSRR